MKNKKNLKGFTLVELVIVGTLMVIIMGMVLNLIRPMNRFYQRTQNLADANDIGGIVMDTVDNSIRYATDMVILEDYEGVPLMKDGCLIDASGVQSFKYKFTNVIILEEDMPRGKVLDGYDPNDSPAHRKGATGSILQAPVLTTGDGIDFSKLRYVGGEDIYNDYSARFDAGLNIVDERNKCVTLDMKLLKPEYRNGQYVFEKEVYNQQRDIELVNINLRRSSFKVEYYSNKAGTNANPIDYNKFPKSAPTSTATASQQELFTSGLHTFIFFTNAATDSTSTEVPVGVKIDGQTDYFGPLTYNRGDIIPAADIEAFKNFARSFEGEEDRGGIPFSLTLSKIESTLGENISAYESGTKTVTQDFDFIAYYSGVPNIPPLGSYSFIDHDGNVISSGNIVAQAISDTGGEVPAPNADNYVDNSGAEPVEMMPNRDPMFRFAEGTEFFDPTEEYSGNHTWYVAYEAVPMADFKFLDTDGSDITTLKFKAAYDYLDEARQPQTNVPLTGQEIGADPQIGALTVTVPAGENFERWEVHDVTGGSDIIVGTNNGNFDNSWYPEEGHSYEVHPITQPIPAGGLLPPSGGSSPIVVTPATYNPWYWPMWKFDIDLVNNESTPIKGATFEVTFNEAIKNDFATSQGMNCFGYTNASVSLDPNDNKILRVNIQGADWGQVQPGGSTRMTLQVHPDDQNSTSLDIVDVKCTGTTPV